MNEIVASAGVYLLVKDLMHWRRYRRAAAINGCAIIKSKQMGVTFNRVISVVSMCPNLISTPLMFSSTCTRKGLHVTHTWGGNAGWLGPVLLTRYASVLVQKAAKFRVALIKLLSVAGISLHECVLPANPPRSKIRISLLITIGKASCFMFFFSPSDHAQSARKGRKVIWRSRGGLNYFIIARRKFLINRSSSICFSLFKNALPGVAERPAGQGVFINSFGATGNIPPV